jgi:hypothetical protein
MDCNPLMDIVIDLLLFLELSDHRIVDEDAAVAMMEQIGADLQRLGASEREQFLSHLRIRARQAANDAERQTIEAIAANIGLVAE